MDELAPGFLEECQGLDTKNAKTLLADLAMQDSEIIEAREEDQDYQQKKAAFEVCKESYSEPLKVNKLKRSFIIRVLKDRGAA